MSAPVLTELSTAVTFAEDTVNATPQLLFAGANVADAEGNWTGGHLIISGVLSQDRLSILNQGVGAGQIGFNSGTGAITYGGVTIGTASGGSGATLDIIFAAGATSVSIEALFKAITYGNVSQTPTAIRDLTVSLTDGGGLAPTGRADFFPGPSALDNLHLPSPYYLNSPATADLDGDGDLDLVVGASGGLIAYVKNTGTASAPVFVQQSGGADPFAAIDTGDNWNNVSLADLDGDGDIDLVVATVYGMRYYRNDGTPTSPVFSNQTATAANRLPAGVNTQGGSAVLVDFSGDGKVDLVTNNHSNGQMRYFLNTGTVAAPVFTEQTGGANPFQGLFVQGRFALGDADNDGDADLIHLNSGGDLQYVENVGGVMTTRTGVNSPVWGSSFPFYPGNAGVPFLMDLDGDGDLDLGAAENDGMVWRTFLNTPVLSSYSIRVTVNAQTDAAIAVNDTVAVNANASANGNVATNDTGVDGGAPVVTHVNGVAASVGTQITLASGARLTLNANGTLTYNPNGAFNALGAAGSGASNTATHEDVTYTLTGGVTATVRFNITGVDDADNLDGTAGVNTIDGGLLNDIIDGGAQNDTLHGGSGDDYLKGGAGIDAMFGGTGNDTYVIDQIGDTADETGGDGVDLVWSRVDWTLGAGFENLTLGAGALAAGGTGNELNNVITGNAKANILQGEDGDDTLIGDGGNDLLSGGDGADILDGGLQNDELNGGADNDSLTGGGGNDLLNGGEGADAMNGGAGHDYYVVDDWSDTVIETLAGAAGGTDTVMSWISITGAGLAANVENLILLGSDGTWGWGNALGNAITGNGGDNRFLGMGGNDTIFGDGGDDVILGGAGSDKLTGGAGADVFMFNASDLLAAAVERDQIMDLSFVDGDVIDLSGIDADAAAAGDQAFSFVAKFTKAAGQATLKYVGGITTLELDVDGDGKADFRIVITGDHHGTTGDLSETQGDGGWIL